MPDLIRVTVERMGEAYPKLRSNEAFVLKVGSSEEERFSGTYRHGIALFEAEVERAKATGSGVFPGEIIPPTTGRPSRGPSST